MNIIYHCMFCRKKLYFDKEKLVQHFKKGCPKMKGKCKHSLILEANGLSCHVYMNEKNCHLDVKKDLLPFVYWPDAVKYFTTNNDWKSAHAMDSDWSSSEDEEEGGDSSD
jgi:hypothetical protein